MPPSPVISRIEAVVNTASGGVTPQAAEQMRAIFAERGLAARVHAAEGAEVGVRLRAAVDAAPDLLVVLAGDGTARAAAELAGPDGPAIAPLPGGTMNLLPHAIYGAVPWRTALEAALDGGEARAIGGGEVDGRNFLVAAVLGAPALWAPAREAVRHGRLTMALARARRAWRRTFSGRLRYVLDDGPRGKAEALAFLCPMASKAMAGDDQALEAAVIDPRSLGEAARLGFSALLDDWRADPAVQAARCRSAGVWAAGPISAVLDGEPTRLPAAARIEWRPNLARVLVPRRP